METTTTTSTIPSTVSPETLAARTGFKAKAEKHFNEDIPARFDGSDADGSSISKLFAAEVDAGTYDHCDEYEISEEIGCFTSTQRILNIIADETERIETEAREILASAILEKAEAMGIEWTQAKYDALNVDRFVTDDEWHHLFALVARDDCASTYADQLCDDADDAIMDADNKVSDQE